MKLYRTLAAAALNLVACANPSGQPVVGADDSSLKEVDLQLPAKSGLPAAVAAKLTNYRLTITPNQGISGCPATDADKIYNPGKYDDKGVLSAKLKKGCVYTVALDLGYVDPADAKAVYTVWYLGDTQADARSAGDKIAVTIALHLSPDRANDANNTVPPTVTVQSTDVNLGVDAKFPTGTGTATPTATIQNTATATATATAVVTATATDSGTSVVTSTPVATSTNVDPQAALRSQTLPLLNKYCADCHATSFPPLFLAGDADAQWAGVQQYANPIYVSLFWEASPGSKMPQGTARQAKLGSDRQVMMNAMQALQP